MVEPAVSSIPTGLLPYQAGRVDNSPVNDRPWDQTEQRDEHQRDALGEAFVPLVDAPVVDQDVADLPGASQRVHHA